MTATKHLIIYLELPIMAEQLTPLSAISDLYVSVEMGLKQIWKEVDIQNEFSDQHFTMQTGLLAESFCVANLLGAFADFSSFFCPGVNLCAQLNPGEGP